MNEQLLLPGLGVREPASIDNMFIAIVPDEEMAKRIKGLGHEVGKLLGVRGKFRPMELLHITLCHVGTYRGGLRPGHEKIARRICEEVASRFHPVEVGLDRVGCFTGREDGLPFVLQSTDADPDLYALNESLVTGLLKQGVRSSGNQGFTPHVTMAYVKEAVDQVPIQPIRWTAGEIVLIHSLVGKSEHRVLGRWPLVG